MAGTINVYTCILLIYIVISTFVLVKGHSAWSSIDNVFHKSCDISLALSVTYGDSFEKCFVGCQHHSDCTMFMFQHRIGQCAFFDTSVHSIIFHETLPLCMYKTVSKSFSDHTVCNSLERFDILEETCYQSDCPSPSEIEDADVLSSTTELGSTSRYKCKPGFTGTGNPSIVCQTNATWSFTNFNCMNAYCPVPGAYENTVPLLSPETKLGSSVRYSCLPGYFLSGNPEIKCQLNATWSTANFFCSACPPAKYISNAVLQSTDTEIGTIAHYECATGYHAVGDPEIRCQANASWTTTDFFCEKVCSVPASVSNAQLVSVEYTNNDSEYRIGTILNYTCDFGYHGDGNITTNVCDQYGRWEPRNVMCCRNGTVSKNSKCFHAFSIESVANYSEAKEMCKLDGSNLASTVESLYNVLMDKGVNLTQLMLYQYTKSDLQENLFEYCLSQHLNTTDLESYRNATYEETSQKIMDNGWDTGGDPYTVNYCSKYILYNWFPGEPNGFDLQHCIVLGPFSNFMYIDISCEFLDTSPFNKEDIGFTCTYVPPTV